MYIYFTYIYVNIFLTRNMSSLNQKRDHLSHTDHVTQVPCIPNLMGNVVRAWEYNGGSPESAMGVAAQESNPQIKRLRVYKGLVVHWPILFSKERKERRERERPLFWNVNKSSLGRVVDNL